MRKNTSVTLGEHFDVFIDEQVKKGRYGSASETVRAGLRLLEASETKLSFLRKSLEDGESSGISDYSLEGIIQELDAE